MAEGDPGAARRVLLGRCVADVRRDSSPIPIEDLTGAEIEAIGEAIEARDPGAVVSVGYLCPACGASGHCFLHPPGFVWRKFQNDAQRLLYEIHALARAYGWREADVLALSAQRRRRYLRLTSQ
jgi:hypothetical protein